MVPAVAALLALLAFFPGCAKKSSPEQDALSWPRWLGPDGNGISKETAWDPHAIDGGAKILWKADVSLGFSNVALQNNRLYTMGWKGTTELSCLDASTGKPIWKVKLGEGSEEPYSTPAIDGEFVYAVTADGDVACVRAANGRIQWLKSLEGDFQAVKPAYGFGASPLVDGDLLLLTVNTSGLALDKKTGRKIWGSPPPPDSASIKTFTGGGTTGTDYSTAVTYDFQGTRFALFSSYEGIHAVDEKTGKPSWMLPWGVYYGAHAVDPLVFGTSIFVNEMQDSAYLIDVSKGDGRVVWKNRNLLSEISNAVVADGFIYGAHGGPSASFGTFFKCLDARTGRVMWEKDFGYDKQLSVTASDGKLIILGENGLLHIAEMTPSGYKEISSCDVFAGQKHPKKFYTPPVLYHGRIYCRNYAGDIVCVDVRTAAG